MHTQLNTPMFSPFLRLRIARRRVVNAWAESEHAQPLAVAAAILVVLLGSIAVVIAEVW